MAVDANQQDLNLGDEVFIRARIVEMTGDVLHLHTSIPSEAYPQGTRINLISGQVEKMEQVVEPKEPLNSDGTEPQSADATSGEGKSESKDKEASGNGGGKKKSGKDK